MHGWSRWLRRFDFGTVPLVLILYIPSFIFKRIEEENKYDRRKRKKIKRGRQEERERERTTKENRRD